MNSKIIQRLQNSFFTRWVWRFWQHEDTGYITMLPFWRSAGRRWYRTHWKE